ncbi:transposase family protein [Parapusillimonas sp. SGNA-6]|nr:transposase family protein [Parapusillimonas sp. SGNA-6]
MSQNRVATASFYPSRLNTDERVASTYRQTSLLSGLTKCKARKTIRSLEQIMEWRGKLKIIRCDNGPEYASSALMNWAEKRHITLQFIQPGKPQQNAYTERCAMTGSHTTCSTRCLMSRTSQRVGSGLTITNGQIWPWAALHQFKKWP